MGHMTFVFFDFLENRFFGHSLITTFVLSTPAGSLALLIIIMHKSAAVLLAYWQPQEPDMRCLLTSVRPLSARPLHNVVGKVRLWPSFLSQFRCSCILLHCFS